MGLKGFLLHPEKDSDLKSGDIFLMPFSSLLTVLTPESLFFFFCLLSVSGKRCFPDTVTPLSKLRGNLPEVGQASPA